MAQYLTDPAGTLEIRHAGKTFVTTEGEVCALNEITLAVSEGEFVAIVGPSGCGKSTLLRLVAGLDTPTHGDIRLQGQPVAPADRRCAIMFQEPRLFPWKKVVANVKAGTRRSSASASPEQWLTRVGLQGFGSHYPHQLSGGMAQRAALARALIGHPEILLLDEPFGALDALTRLQMQDVLLDVWTGSGATVVMVTHDIDEALHMADRVVIMGPRPGTIDILDVPAQRPRERSDPTLANQRTAVLHYFGIGEECTGSVATSFNAAAD